MTDPTLQQLHNKRGQKKGKVTLIEKKVQAFPEEEEPPSIKVIAKLSDSLEKDMQGFLEHHQNVLNFCEAQEPFDQAAYDRELKEGEELEVRKDELTLQLEEWTFVSQLFDDMHDLTHKFSDWRDSSNPESDSYRPSLEKMLAEIEEALQRAKGSRHARAESYSKAIRDIRANLTTALHRIPSRATPHSSAEASSRSKKRATKFELKMPKFDGNPLNWAHFSNLFTETIDSWDNINPEEKKCVLHEAMLTDKDREIIFQYLSLEDGFEMAFKALEREYGSAHKIVPLLLEIITRPACHQPTAEGIAAWSKQFWTSYTHLQRLDVGMSHLLAFLSLNTLSGRLLDRWTLHYPTLDRVPNLEDMKSFFSTISETMSAPTIHTFGSTASAKVASSGSGSSHHKSSTPKAKPISTSVKPSRTCPLCSDSAHPVGRCSIFLGYTLDQRNKYARDNKLCTNCLGPHAYAQCTSTHTCRTCHGKHHSLLHREKPNSSTTPSSTEVATLLSLGGESSEAITEEGTTPPAHAFLNTALVEACHKDKVLQCRLAMDSGSTTSLITESLASQLRLKRHPHRLSLAGAYGNSRSKHFVEVLLRSLHDPNQQRTLKLSVVKNLPDATPYTDHQQLSTFIKSQGFTPADPYFGGSLDLLIGAMDSFSLQAEKPIRHFVNEKLVLTPTIFGDMVFGSRPSGQTGCVFSIQATPDDLQTSLERLWELEQLPEESKLSTSEQSALDQFQSEHSIQSDGHYVVKLPRAQEAPNLGSSRKIALSRFTSNEKTLTKKNKLQEFNSALREYLSLDHAEVIPKNEIFNPRHLSFYLPVHGVFKDTSSTTKLRPVFDGSAKSSTGSSLNDLLLPGPNLYPLLTDVLIKFRTHAIGMSADISKMLREILLHPDDRDLHRFLLRGEGDKLQDCRMKRVTFGIKSSPFLATQVLRHHAQQFYEEFPLAAEAILQCFYVDDYLSGADSVEQAFIIRAELCHLLKKAGMTLRKWRSSSPALLEIIPESLKETEPLTINSTTGAPKALGMHWEVTSDTLQVAMPTPSSKSPTTKRIIASDAARVFDLLGLYAPYTISAKILLQALWKSGIDWDTPVPADIDSAWKQWIEELPQLARKNISRRYHLSASPVCHTSLHAFSDASEKAYGCVIYIRFQHEDGSINTSLVMAKARVAPVKQKLTIPKSELVAAHMAAKLIGWSAQHLTGRNTWVDRFLHCVVLDDEGIEVCGDLSSEEFVPAFRRFCARRGLPQKIYTDNGTNFVGTARELKEIQHILNSSEDTLIRLSSDNMVEWHFTPPRAPNFGGLWEASIKQMKVALRKLVTPHALKLEELQTVLTEIEAILNSRPLSPIHSTETTDDLVLTPGHFLVGRPLKSPARVPVNEKLKITHLKRWQLVERLTQDLWTRWKGTYLQSLQARKKWHRHTTPLKVNDIVILQDETMVTLHRLPLARITEIYPGDDGVIRTVDLLINGRIYKRAVNRLIPLFSPELSTPQSTPLQSTLPNQHTTPKELPLPLHHYNLRQRSAGSAAKETTSSSPPPEYVQVPNTESEQ